MRHLDSRDQLALNIARNTDAENFWINKLSGNPNKTTFPYDNRKIHGNQGPAKVFKFKLPGELFSKLMHISNHSLPRLHMILTAGLMALLFKYTGNEDIIVGTSIFKQDIQTEFINTVLPLRHQLEHGVTFKELLLQVRAAIFEVNENQNYPMELLIRKLKLQYSRDDDFPLFDVGILLENIQDPGYIKHIKVNLLFFFSQIGEYIEGRVEYNSLLYYDATIERLVAHYNLLLHQVLADVNKKIASIDILTWEEKKQLMAFNHTETPYPKDKTIHELFEQQVEKTPDNIALQRSPQETLTYQELNDRARQLTAWIRKRGLGRENIVGIMAEHSFEVIAVIMGILKAGSAYLPIEPDYPKARAKYILEDSAAVLLLTHKGYAAHLNWQGTIINIEDILTKQINTIAPGIRKAQPADLAYVIYTSGSTGKPKGVMVQHQGLVNYIWWAARYYVKKEKVNFPLYTPLSFDLTVTSIFTPLITGNTIIVYEAGDKESLPDKIIDDNKADIIKLTPAHLKLIKEKEIERNYNYNVKRFIVGGEELETQLARDIYTHFNENIEIYNEYGPTETVVGCMIYKFNPGKDNRRSVPIGSPVDNTQIYILDRNQKPLPPGAEGEIHISGEGVARGYLNKPQLTREKFIENPFVFGKRMYRSGDLARRLPDGNLEFLGRLDQHQVKIRGYRIEPGEIENNLLKHPQINEAVVLAKEKNGEKYLCAYIVSKEEINVSGLKGYLSSLLLDYMIPAYIKQIEKIPLTPNGKIDTKALPFPEIRPQGVYTAPRDSVENILAQLWSEVLAIDEIIGIDDNFFELGGHSLNAAVLVSKVHQSLEVKLPLAEIFKTPNIRGLAGYIKDTEEYRYASIEPVEKKEYHLLSSAQKRLYIIQRMDLESTAYNMPELIPLTTAPDKGKLEETFKKLINRHESLRTSFLMIDEEPVQKVQEFENVEFKIEYKEVEVEVKVEEERSSVLEGTRGLAPLSIPAARSPQPAAALINSFIRPFDLSQAPLLRVGLMELPHTPADLRIHTSPAAPTTHQGESPGNRYILMVDMHHIISDGVSHQILVKDFMTIFNGKRLPRLRLQYKDFARWQNKEKENLVHQERYWLREFEQKIPVLNLPTDFPRPAIQDFEGSIETFDIPADHDRALKNIGLEENATMYMVLLALFNILLSKLSGQEDIVLGTPIAGRRHTDLQDIIGMFVNTLALRNFPKAQKTFREFLTEVKERSLKAFENQDYQFEDLVEKVVKERDANRNPLFDVMFSFTDIETAAKEKPAQKNPTPGQNLNLYENINRTSKFDLAMEITESATSLFLFYEYSTKLFKKETIKKYVDYFKAIVSAVSENPDKKLSDIDVISSEDKKELIKKARESKGKSFLNKNIETNQDQSGQHQAEFDF